MFQIAHISDPHLSRQYYRENIKSFKMLLRSILNEGADHIMISGDIVSTADEDDYYLAREILSNHQLLDSSRLTIVPGESLISSAGRIEQPISLVFRSISGVSTMRGILNCSRVHFAETFQGVTRLDEKNLSPFIKTVRTIQHHRIEFNSSMVNQAKSVRDKRHVGRSAN